MRTDADLALFGSDQLERSSLARQLAAQHGYYEWAREGRRVPVIEEALAALDSTIPHTDRSVLNWGDSRIGNVIYRNCRPAAVLDWEMATTGPPEVDVAWMVFLHAFMQEMITKFMPDIFSSGNLTGIAELLRKDRVVDYYEKVAGERLDDLIWYEAFAGLRFAIILMRMSLRAAASGAMPAATDPDDLIMFAPMLRRLVSAIGS